MRQFLVGTFLLAGANKPQRHVFLLGFAEQV